MPIQSFNPFTQEVIKEFEELTYEELASKINHSYSTFLSWKEKSITDRKELFKNLITVLNENKDKYAQDMTDEVGKTFSSAKGEVEKCILNIEYYLDNIEDFLSDEQVETEHKESFQTFEPMGPIFFVMPWNFPFWQVLRQAVPTIMAGNTVLLKHASNVPMSSLNIEDAFLKAGFPEGVFQSLLVNSSRSEEIISNFKVKAVSLTGSGSAGSAVASIAGKYIKKSVLELGGNDAFIVFPDADIEKAVKTCSSARLKNSGQVCNSPKRVIVHKDIADKFIEVLKANYESKILGDPNNAETNMGPLVSKSAKDEVENQVNSSIEKGAELITGGSGEGFFYKPTILLLNPDTSVEELKEKEMEAYEDEIFGPVTSVIIVESEEQAIEIANDSRYGLGASIWTKDTQNAKRFISQINAGIVNINQNVSSDPRMATGGVNNSGYGKELSRYGLLEFINIKSVNIND